MEHSVAFYAEINCLTYNQNRTNRLLAGLYYTRPATFVIVIIIIIIIITITVTIIIIMIIIIIIIIIIIVIIISGSSSSSSSSSNSSSSSSSSNSSSSSSKIERYEFSTISYTKLSNNWSNKSCKACSHITDTLD